MKAQANPFLLQERVARKAAIGRRECLGLGAAALAGLYVTGCKSIEQTATANDIALPQLGVLTSDPELRLLQRATFGPAPYDLSRVATLGGVGWLSEQLAPDQIDEPLVLSVRLRPLLDALDADSSLLFDVDDHALVRTLRQATLLRAVYSRRQLYERVVGFWSDHFNIYAYKGEGPQYKVVDDRETIRAHAFGRFRDLLGASARSAAMLGYLDNKSNRKGVPNENYARELMELHTLGIGGGYTQADVQNVARCFTGWTVQRHWRRGRFQFDASAHDDGGKVVLGHRIAPGGGISDGERVLDIVAAHPATADHICRKLCQYFLGAVPPDLHRQLAATFLATDGQIVPVLRTLLSAESLAQASPLLKRPFEYMVSALRALGADTDCGLALQAHLDSMGQAPFAWPMPDGYPMREGAWVSGMIPRWKFAAALAGDQIDATGVNWDALNRRGNALSLDASEIASDALFAQKSSPALVGVRRAIRESCGGDLRRAVAIGLMSPQFQVR